jgi:serine phosphatase RsbU (regulator of sigma subunit)
LQIHFSTGALPPTVIKMTQSVNLQQKYDTLFKYSNDIVIITDPYGVVLDANEKAFSVLGPSIMNNKIDESLGGIASHLTSLCNSHIVQSFHLHSKSRTSVINHMQVTLIPIFSGQKLKEVMLIARDLNELESYKTEVERLREKFNLIKEEQRIINSGKKGERPSSLATTLKKLEVANQKLKDMYTTLNNELELAAILQQSLVPESLIEHEKMKFSFHYEPIGQVGGDYYDVIDIDKNRKGLILADVSGHGVSSAFIAAMLKISFTNYASDKTSPSDVLSKLNKEYCNVIKTGDYVTAFYAIFDTAKNKITYSGAGHPKPLYQHGPGSEVELLASEGFFIGMFEEADYEDSALEFGEGDRFLAYTDGIIEAYSEEKNEQFGEARLLKSFIKHQDKSIDQIVQLIIKDVKSFMHKSKFYDDMAIVSVEYKKQGEKR